MWKFTSDRCSAEYESELAFVLVDILLKLYPKHFPELRQRGFLRSGA